jgi:L-2-hydroxyglutarate oxidase LhgO
MTSYDFDAVVIGAGAVGLGCGYALGRRGLTVAVLEKNPGIGQEISSRNSEVIHAGLYYPTDSLKARLCVAGRRTLYQFLDDHGVAYNRCGKLVVATEDHEVARIEGIYQQALINGVEDLERLTARQVHALEPEVKAVMAILSPQTGVLDSHGYMVALRREIEAAGGAVVTSTPFEGASPTAGGGFAVRAGGAQATTLSCRLLVTAPGLGAQRAAAAIEGFPAHTIPKLYLAKGVYFLLRGKAPFSRLVYPPPIPGALGVHYCVDMGGQARFGPDLVFVDHESYDVDPARAPGFAASIRRFWPGVPEDALSPAYAGIRPKLHGPGEPQPDYRIDGPKAHGIDGLVALFGIESPGLTSSLAIGEEVAARIVPDA